MKQYAWHLLGVAALCGWATTVHAQDASKGAALLADARRALGGEDKLRAIRALDVRGDFKRAAGQTTVSGELQIRLELPGKLRRDEDLSLPGGGPAVIRTEVLDGSTVWEGVSGGGGVFIGRFGRGDRAGGGRGAAGADPQRGLAQIDPARLEEAQRRARQTELSRFMLAWLLTVNGDAAWVATAESPDGKADVIEITTANAPAMRIFLDQNTRMPLMITWQGAAPQLIVRGRRGAAAAGQEAAGGQRSDAGQSGSGPAARREQATLQMTLGDYKAVNGLKLPHLITRAVNDMTIEEWTIDSYRINPSFKADVFTK
jgi:hypothetical protein